jgi:divalent metal cation (Fe/Co/Zn/Cd) transporter
MGGIVVPSGISVSVIQPTIKCSAGYKRMKRIFRAFQLILIIFSSFFMLQDSPRALIGLSEGDTPTEFVLTSLNGTMISLSE